MATIRKITTTWAGLAGTPHMSTMYFTHVAGNAQAIVDEVHEFWQDLTAHIDGSLTHTVEGSTELIDDTTGLLVGIDQVTSQVAASSGAGNACPPATQGLINWRTNTFVNGRALRGKTYIPGPIVTSATADGRPNTTYLALLNTAAAALIAETSGPGPLRVFSRTHLTSATVVSADRYSDFAVLRSRRD